MNWNEVWCVGGGVVLLVGLRLFAKAVAAEYYMHLRLYMENVMQAYREGLLTERQYNMMLSQMPETPALAKLDTWLLKHGVR